MTTKPHTCHAYGCSRVVAPALLMCGRHWRMVPAALQREVWRHYRPGQEVDKRPSRVYIDVMKRAIAAVAAAERAELASRPQMGLFDTTR
jgi:hypothetical protein